MNGRYEIGETVLNNWKLVRLIGEGSYGKVFEARREDFGVAYKAAIKIITIPQSQSEITNARAEGMDHESVTAYFRSFVEEIVQEFALMSRLKGTANVVSYEDHAVIPHESGVGWDILIRMELLTPLLNYTVEHTLTRRDVTQLGIDLCRALELCQKYNIVHRDIKPENIFISELGDYKLGDFGIARTVEKTTGGLSKKGTYTYMAPEVYREEPYNSTVDIYSLGIVLYRLLNENRAPFLPAAPAPITHSDRETALAKRISGAELPKPKNADGRLVEIVLKACAYQPKERYSSPLQMRQELEAILYNREEAPVIYPAGDQAPIKSVEYVPTEAPVPQEPDFAESMFGEAIEHDKTESIFGDVFERQESDRTESIFGDASATSTISDEQALGDEAESYDYEEYEKRVNPQLASSKADSESEQNATALTAKGINWPLALTVLSIYAVIYVVYSFMWLPVSNFVFHVTFCTAYGLLAALFVHICATQTKTTKLTVLGATLLIALGLFVLEMTLVGASLMFYVLNVLNPIWFLLTWLIVHLVMRKMGNTRMGYIWAEVLALLPALAYVLLAVFS